MKHWFFFLLLCFVFPALAQEPADTSALPPEEEEEIIVKPNVNEDEKFGLKLSSGITSMIGSEPNNPRPAMYLSGGIYYRRKFKEHWMYQIEGLITSKGGNFSNGDSGYSSIKVYAIELPFIIMHGLNEQNTSSVAFGIQYSHLLNSLMYQGKEPFPETENPSLIRNDASLIGGMQFHTPFVGFQLFLKYGLLNQNDGLISTLAPISSGKSMHHFTFEISMIF